MILPVTENIPTYILPETVIEIGGVMRCCVSSLGEEYNGRRVKIGDKASCKFCHQSFTLVAPKEARRTAYRNLTKPIWKPDWQLADWNPEMP